MGKNKDYIVNRYVRLTKTTKLISTPPPYSDVPFITKYKVCIVNEYASGHESEYEYKEYNVESEAKTAFDFMLKNNGRTEICEIIQKEKLK